LPAAETAQSIEESSQFSVLSRSRRIQGFSENRELRTDFVRDEG